MTAVNTHVNEKADGAGRNLSWIHHVPTIRQWIQDSWLDIIAVIAAGILVRPNPYASLSFAILTESSFSLLA